MSQPLITKYRPTAFEQVIGNEAAINALVREVNGNSRPHAYLFTGPSGTGKTTLARIVATAVEASVMEIDAASHSGVDDIRVLVSTSGYKPLVANKMMYIIDECHALSKPAWQALLKLVEEPPDWLFIALCTTEVQKVPETVKNRCYRVLLKSLKPVEIEDFVDTIAGLEGWEVTPETFQAIVQAAEGSPRRALSVLQAGHAARNREELAQVVAQVDSDTSPTQELAKLLISGNRDWKRARGLLEQIDDEDEAVSIICSYIAAAISRAEEAAAQKYWWVLEAFIQANTYDKKVQLICAVGRVLWGTST